MGSFPTPRPFQDTAHEALREGYKNKHRRQVICASTGAGKCLKKGTPIVMASGVTKNVEDIVTGDLLLGPAGDARLVTGTARGYDLMYEITPTKGDPYTVNSAHILSLRKTPGSNGIFLSDGSHIGIDEDIVNVNVEVFMNSNRTARHCLKGWRSPAINAFHGNYNQEDMTIPPYILGAWLGDGTQNEACISKPPCKMVDEWIAYGKSIGYDCRNGNYGNYCGQWYLKSPDRSGHFNIIKSMLNGLGVINNRHIPDCYKFSLINDRLEVIAGLIDSDGCIGHNGIDWISKSERLASDFAFICRSVGLAAYISKCTKGIKKTGFVGTYWRVSISGDTSIIPARDKKCDARQQKKRSLVHGIKIRQVGVGEYFGFEIDGDGLFVLGDFTVTHNTVLGLRIIKEALDRGKFCGFLCDRKTLINQTSSTADRFGLSHGIIQADHWRTDKSQNFQIISVQTMERRKWPIFDVLVVDECHTLRKQWIDFVMENPKMAVIGLTATPFTKGMGKIFSNLINAATMHELTEQGILVPMQVFSGRQIDMKGAKKVAGEWSDKDVEGRGREIIGDVVTEWFKHADNRKTIVFGGTITHCEEMCKAFNEAGVMAAVYTSHTSDEERAEIHDLFNQDDTPLRVLLSVDALAKGYDQTDIGVICDVRPLRKSLSTAIQMWGRGLRCHPGKDKLTLLDFSGNIIRFREDFEDFYFNGVKSLDDGEKLDKKVREEDERVERSCPKCGYTPFAKRCVACGHENVSVSTIEHLPGELLEIKIGKKTVADNPNHLWAQIATYVKQAGKPETAFGRACHLYRDVTGKDPERYMSLSSAPIVDISKALISKIVSRQIAYSKGMQKYQRR